MSRTRGSEVLNATVAYHRNGSEGNGFYVVAFESPIDGELRQFVATVFSGEGNIAILDRDLLANGVIEFGRNSWQYESFKDGILAAVERYNRQ